MGRFTRTRVAVSAGVLVAGVWGSSMALFTDSVDESLAFSSGTLDLVGSGATLLNVTDMAPGDVAYAPLVCELEACQLGHLLSERPHAAAWVERLRARPSVRATGL